MNKWEIKQVMDLVSKSLNSVLINSNKEWTKAELIQKANEFADVYIVLFEKLKNLEEKTELPKIEEKEEPIADEDENLVREWEELVEEKEIEDEETADELKREEAILKGRYNPPSLDL